MPTNLRGRSPSRTSSKTTPKRGSSIPRSSLVFSKTPRMSTDFSSPRGSSRWNTMSDLMESGKRRNTPEHLYGKKIQVICLEYLVGKSREY